MTPRRAARGQPLLVLGLILSAWVGARVAIVTGADEAPQPTAVLAERAPLTAKVAPAPVSAAPAASLATEQGHAGAAHSGGARIAAAWASPASPPFTDPLLRPVTTEPLVAPVAAQGVPARVAAGHQLLWMAAVSLLPTPQEATAYAAQKRSGATLAPAAPTPR